MADKPKKPQKLRARLPRGLADRGPAEIAATRAMVEKIRAVYERYGFEAVETPAIEFTDALGKFLPDQDRPNEGVFSFQDDDEQWMSLRYDLTAPLARYVAENYDALPKPYRSYREGYVYRNEKPGPGRFRQFMQFDADTVGSASPAADAEMCMMAADTMEALGIRPSQFIVKINNRKLLDGVLESVGLSGAENATLKLTVLRAMDKFDKFGPEGVRLLLGAGRKDESGDFTKGAGLDEKAISLILSVFGSGIVLTEPATRDEKRARPLDTLTFPSSDKTSEWHAKVTFESVFETLDFVRKRLGRTVDVFEEGVRELQQIAELLNSSGYGDGRIQIDPSVVRGLEYYTGPVYEVELLIPAQDDKGRPVRFGSVGGGGRYDGLVSRFRGEPVPATGFSIGVSRLQAALDLINRDKPQPPAFGPVVVTVFGGEIAHYQKFVALLRSAGIRAELYLGNPKHSLGQQMKYADRRNAPCAIIQGSDEKAAGKLQIKDLILGAGLADTEDRIEYLRKQAEAQLLVDESELVDAVRKVLARHGVTW